MSAHLVQSVGAPIKISDLLFALTSRKPAAEFIDKLQAFTNQQHLFLTNSGTCALYHLLQALKNTKQGNEVILPAYTAPSLILPIKKAGLKPVLCDISLHTFNMDLNQLDHFITPNTLAILSVHMFGLPFATEKVRALTTDQNIFIIDDAASSMGSYRTGRLTGTLGDAGFFSFNRGKNFTTFSGGCIFSNDPRVAAIVSSHTVAIPERTLQKRFKLSLQIFAFTLAMKPFLYNMLKPLIDRFKYQQLHTDFEVQRFEQMQARLGARIFSRFNESATTRDRNGSYLYKRLKKLNQIVLPKIDLRDRVVYNQFPFLCKDPQQRDALNIVLNNSGIEATTLYPEPLHRIDHPAYNLGYSLNIDPFPKASYFAKRILLIPVHPLVEKSKLDRVAELIYKELS